MADKELITVAGYAAAEFTEKKSRFIGHAAPAADEKEAQRFLERIRAEHKTANHNCYAWVCGENDSQQRSSDMGEPSGTAGRPILEAIKRAGLHNTVVVVTRYFGGILLGAGGLARAYGKGAQLALDAARKVRMVPGRRCALTFDYGLLGRVESFLQQQDCRVEDKIYAEQVCFICLLEESRLTELEKALGDVSGGVLHWQDLGESVDIAQPL
ncbi:MAG: YigZ family protein [Firmicutes bacterium]|nr:YigZ family protein [Bacillota bacterium]